MRNLIYLLLRRMRMPLIVIILAYAVSILGLVLIPGVDDQGREPNHDRECDGGKYSRDAATPVRVIA